MFLYKKQQLDNDGGVGKGTFSHCTSAAAALGIDIGNYHQKRVKERMKKGDEIG
jgi:hypothetical protein